MTTCWLSTAAQECLFVLRLAQPQTPGSLLLESSGRCIGQPTHEIPCRPTTWTPKVCTTMAIAGLFLGSFGGAFVLHAFEIDPGTYQTQNSGPIEQTLPGSKKDLIMIKGHMPVAPEFGLLRRNIPPDQRTAEPRGSNYPNVRCHK